MKYAGKNVVSTNGSSTNHGRPSELTVVRLGDDVVLRQAMPGGNSYAIKLDGDTAGLLGAELVGSTKRVLPELLRSIGQLLAGDPTAPR